MKICEISYGRDQLYVRFGEPPEGGRSMVWQAPNFYGAGRAGQHEAGLSVYPIEWDEKAGRYSIECHSAASLDALLSQKRPAFMMVGEEAESEGIDGEPLLAKFRAVRAMRYDELFFWGWDSEMPEDYLELEDD